MKQAFFQFKHAQLHYRVAGNGRKTVLAFHGFGQDGSVFIPFTHHHPEVTLYSFDLFFHGKSQWHHGEEPLENTFWKELMLAFLREHRIERFSLLGYSMGGKFALSTLEVLSERIESITLLAPDGIKTSFWYSLATYPVALRKLFRSMIDHPQRFYSLAHAAHSLRLIDKGILRFVEHQMNSHEKRERVYFSWVVFRHLKFKLQYLANLITQYNIQLTIVTGKHDKIITSQNMKLFTKLVPHHTHVDLECGHNALISRWIESIPKPSAKTV